MRLSRPWLTAGSQRPLPTALAGERNRARSLSTPGTRLQRLSPSSSPALQPTIGGMHRDDMELYLQALSHSRSSLWMPKSLFVFSSAKYNATDVNDCLKHGVRRTGSDATRVRVFPLCRSPAVPWRELGRLLTAAALSLGPATQASLSLIFSDWGTS